MQHSNPNDWPNAPTGVKSLRRVMHAVHNDPTPSPVRTKRKYLLVVVAVVVVVVVVV
jgi:hypothetical protein